MTQLANTQQITHTGAVCLEIFKLLQDKPVTAYANTFTSLGVNLFTSMEPQPPNTTTSLVKGKEWKWTQVCVWGDSRKNKLMIYLEKNLGLNYVVFAQFYPSLYSHLYLNPSRIFSVMFLHLICIYSAIIFSTLLSPPFSHPFSLLYFSSNFSIISASHWVFILYISLSHDFLPNCINCINCYSGTASMCWLLTLPSLPSYNWLKMTTVRHYFPPSSFLLFLSLALPLSIYIHLLHLLFLLLLFLLLLPATFPLLHRPPWVLFTVLQGWQ